MGIYKRGRSKEYDPFDKKSKMPKSPGEYRVIGGDSKNKKIKYIGETNDLRRRTGEHRRSGKIQLGDKVAIKIADGRSTSKTRRRHEKEKILKHKPFGNKSIGGEGRKANRAVRKSFDMSPQENKRGCLSTTFDILMILCTGGLWFIWMHRRKRKQK